MTPSEVDRRKEVLQVEVEHPSPMTVLAGVRDDRFPTLEAVRRTILTLVRLVDFVDAVLKEIGETTLKEFQAFARCLDGSGPAGFRLAMSNVRYLAVGGSLKRMNESADGLNFNNSAKSARESAALR